MERNQVNLNARELLKRDGSLFLLYSPERQILDAQIAEDGAIELSILDETYSTYLIVSIAASIASLQQTKVRLNLLDGKVLEIDHTDPKLSDVIDLHNTLGWLSKKIGKEIKLIIAGEDH